MSDGYRNGAFALGLVTGIGLAINLLLWFSYIARQQADQATQPENNAQRKQIEPYWEGVVGAFVSPSDTLAQWIMAIFTFGATLVLVLTLRAANRTNQSAIKAANAATDANAIMRAERRPWLTVEIIRPIEFTFSNEEQNRFSYYLRYRIKNKGKMPARYRDVQVKFSRRDWGFVAAGSEDAAHLHIKSRNRVRSRAPRIVFPDEEVEGGFWGAIMELEGVDADIEHATVFVAASIAYWLDAKGEEVGCTTASHVLSNEEQMFGPFAYNIGRVAEYGHID